MIIITIILTLPQKRLRCFSKTLFFKSRHSLFHYGYDCQFNLNLFILMKKIVKHLAYVVSFVHEKVQYANKINSMTICYNESMNVKLASHCLFACLCLCVVCLKRI